MGFQDFANGDVFDEAAADNLMDQSIIKCTSSSRPPAVDNRIILETDTGYVRQYRASTTFWEPILSGMQPKTASPNPTLTAATTNPVLGSGAVQSGRYVVSAGRTCNYWGQIQFGTSGVNAGSGQYLISLPFQAATNGGPAFPGVGSAILRQNSGGALRNGNVYIAAGATTMAIMAADALVTNNAPWVWAAQDYIAWDITYEITGGAA